MALTSRPEVISFVGGLPAPELFDLAGLRAAFDRAACPPPGPTCSSRPGRSRR
ncbi:hypothetical protein [Actinosynnema sp. NPDC023587]|uniref:hypothetical protein n=1 Tax=Actinosynnema sp. NPDC023587 TaxID=3154695 RepID=UPI0033D3FCF0